MYHIIENSKLYNVSQRASHLKGRVCLHTTPVFGYSLPIQFRHGGSSTGGAFLKFLVRTAMRFVCNKVRFF